MSVCVLGKTIAPHHKGKSANSRLLEFIIVVCSLGCRKLKIARLYDRALRPCVCVCAYQ